MSYFDHNATTPLAQEAESAWLEASRRFWANPSSPYRTAARAQNRLNECRIFFSEVMSCEPENLVFTAGATEANNAYFRYLAKTFPNAQILISAVEHPCVVDSATYYFGERCHRVPVDSHGVVKLEELEQMLKEIRPISLSVMAVNNETGVVQPFRECAEISKRAHVFYHCDASQWFGKMIGAESPISDFTVGCAHKFAGPKGVGFVACSENLRSLRFQLGGTQEHEHRAGTENLPSILAMEAIFRILNDRDQAELIRLKKMRDAFEASVLKALPGAKVVGKQVERLWNTSMLIMPSAKNTRWVNRLDKAGYEVSTGSACSVGKGGPSHVLTAMGYSAEEATCAIRVSSWWDTSGADWEGLASEIIKTAVFFDKEASEGSSIISI